MDDIMGKNFIVKQSVTINAPAAKIWDALVNPEKIKRYLFGTEAVSDWKAGSPIKYKGVWEGKAYEDKGTILKIVPEKLFESTYWSSAYGVPDKPENYKKVTYELLPEREGVKLVLTQDNNATEEEKNHSEQNWRVVLGGLKDLVEKE
jgi:uncharacterized protein YndB with AHSA1/START domain